MANGACRNADVILALGTRFDDRATSAWLPGMTYSFPPTKLIHVDIDSNEIGRNFQPAIGIIGDARLVLEQLLAYKKADVASRRAAWLSRIDAWRKKWVAATTEAKRSDAVPIRRRARRCRSAPGGAGRRHRALRRGRSSQLAGLGLGGAQAAHLAADLGLRLDGLRRGWRTRRQAGGAGSSGRLRLRRRRLRHVAQRRADGGRVQHPAGVAGVEQLRLRCDPRPADGILRQDPRTGLRLHRSKGQLFSADYAAMARSMGANGVTVEKPGDLAPQLEAAIASNRPTVLDVRVERNNRQLASGSWELPPIPPPLPNFGWGEE